jgi:microcystin synthetase protein McyB/microcystin synthetase protein McyC
MSNLNLSLWDYIFKIGCQNPEDYVISDSKKSYTWKDLFCLIDHHLDNFRGRKGQFLAFYADRTVDSVAIMLGCLKNGLVFVPISRDQPLVRIHGALNQLSEYEVYDPSKSSFEKYDSGPSTAVILKHSLMYVLFTSGSTGVPKGVQITEKNLLNTLNWSRNYFNWRSSDVIGIVTPFNFDISIFDLFIGLTQNIKMHIFPTMLNTNGMVDHIINNRITSIFSTPSFFSLLAKQVNDEFKSKSKLF